MLIITNTHTIMNTSLFKTLTLTAVVLMVPMAVFAGAPEGNDPHQDAYEQQAREAAAQAQQEAAEPQEDKEDAGFWQFLNNTNTEVQPGAKDVAQADAPEAKEVAEVNPFVNRHSAQGSTVARHGAPSASPIKGWWWPLVALIGLLGLAWFGTSGIESSPATGGGSTAMHSPVTKQKSKKTLTKASTMKSVAIATAGACGAGAGSCLVGMGAKDDSKTTAQETYHADAMIFSCHGCGDEHAVDAHCKQCVEVAARAMGVPKQDVETVSCEGCGHSFSPTCQTCRDVFVKG